MCRGERRPRLEGNATAAPDLHRDDVVPARVRGDLRDQEADHFDLVVRPKVRLARQPGRQGDGIEVLGPAPHEALRRHALQFTNVGTCVTK